ncbi:MAG: hypothetical protein J5769_06915 [Bacteroidales bacterium]|nr:hypothetical protein [Bacteroidales bacterium]
MKKSTVLLLAAGLMSACAMIDPEKPREIPEETMTTVPMDGLARLLSTLPIGPSQMKEVADAVGSSSGNGYDEEYTMKQLFASPGSGVGDMPSKAVSYDTPLRDLIESAVRSGTKGLSGEDYGDPEDYLRDLSSSDLQIYWPYAQAWDGSSAPVITYDPGDDSDANMGYVIGGGEIVVTEEVARERPVWVINRNSDAGYTSLELLRREDPSWGSGGGEVIVRPRASATTDIRTLVIKSMKVERQYDSWFAGGAEFFFKCGAVENFKASTEAELRLYQPTITDFMIVVQRSQIGQDIPLGALLVSEWTKSLTSCGFMIVEDDGGSQTTWKCSAVVKYNSKSYGFEVELPLRSRDDIVWRGQVTRSFVEKYSGAPVSFGEMSLVMELI